MADRSKTNPDDTQSEAKKGFLENKAVLLGLIVIVQALVAIGLTHYILVPKLTVQQATLSPGNIADLTPLSTCTNLEQLELFCDRKLTTLEPLGNLDCLQVLCIQGASINNLKPILHLPIKKLILMDCEIESLSGIENLQSVSWMNVSGNQLQDFTWIALLPNLDAVIYESNGHGVSDEVEVQIQKLIADHPNLRKTIDP